MRTAHLSWNKLRKRHSRNKPVHEDKVAEASSHHEKMEDFVRAEAFMPCIEEWELECIDNSSDCVYDTAGKQPGECCW